MWKELWAKLDPNLKEEYGYGFYQTSKKFYYTLCGYQCGKAVTKNDTREVI